MSSDADIAPRRRTWTMIVVYMALLSVFVIKNAITFDFPTNFDEAAHYSYVYFLSQHFTLFPDLEDMTMVVPMPRLDLEVGDANYLNHPALYYLMMVPIYRLFDGDFMAIRLATSLIHLASLGLLAVAFGTVLNRAVLLFVLASALLFVPLPHILGTMVTNDTLVLFAACLLVWSILLSRSRPILGYAGAATAVLLAGFTKLTALVSIFPIFAICFLLAPVPGVRARLHAVLAVIIGAVAAVPYLVWFVRYGSVVPSFSDVTFSPGMPLNPADLLDMVTSEPFLIFVGRMIAATMQSLFEPHLTLTLGAESVLFVVLVAALVLAGPVEVAMGNRTLAALFTATTIAVFVFFAIHVVSLYPHYALTGDLRAFHARYYLVILPVIGLAVGCLTQYGVMALRAAILRATAPPSV